MSGAYEIYFVNGWDLAWQLDPWNSLQLSSDSYLNRAPVISPFMSDTVWVAWESYRENNWNIMGAAIYNPVGAVKEKIAGNLSSSVLLQNYPNPFNSSTNIQYLLQRNDFVTIKIYNQIGQQIKILLDQKYESKGIHNVNWDGKDELGVNSPSGIYFYQIK
ncbi:T9SS type A sorting domain-containing protein, partial [candidate division KSB1 bacterium]|nr:T9SS type A sorting domain-containing protein [candidate division KSB1 bacterium]